jgi:hypothetical protein
MKFNCHELSIFGFSELEGGAVGSAEAMLFGYDLSSDSQE